MEHKNISICHILFTAQLGGLEQAYIDYTRAMVMAVMLVVAVILPDAPYRKNLEKLGVKIITCKMRGFDNFL